MPYIGNQPGTGVRSRFIYTATASQTTFTGADNNSKTLKYSDADYIDVYLNGVCLVPVTDYAASTKTSVVLTQAASLNDTLEVVAYDIATISDTVSKADGGTFEDGVTIRTADNTTQLTLESTDADANSGPVLELYRNSSSPADDDVLGEIEFHGENDADEKIQYGLIAAKLQDASDGTEDVRLSFKTITAGTERERVTIQPTEVVINEDSQDLDFRVESNGKTNTLLVNGADDTVGIGIDSPSSMLHLFDGGTDTGITIQSKVAANATSTITMMSRKSDNSNASCVIQNDAGALTFDTNSTERLRITSGGELRVGINTDMGGVINASHADGVAIGSANDQTYYRRIYGTSGANLELRFWNGSNEGSLNSSGAWVNASDVSLKENIADIEYGIDTVKSLKPRKYTMKEGGNSEVGFIAQEMESVVPEVVNTSENPNKDEIKGISYGQLTAVLTKAIQELSAKVDALETENTAIKARLDALEAG